MKLSVIKSTSILMLAAASLSVPLRAADSELKDDTGKTIIRYVVEPPAGMAAVGTKDPARQVGLFLCFPEHDTPTDADIFPVRQALFGSAFAITMCSSPALRKRRSSAWRIWSRSRNSSRGRRRRTPLIRAAFTCSAKAKAGRSRRSSR